MENVKELWKSSGKYMENQEKCMENNEKCREIMNNYGKCR